MEREEREELGWEREEGCKGARDATAKEKKRKEKGRNLRELKEM